MSIFSLDWQAEAIANHCLHVVGAEEGQVQFLYSLRFVDVEPIRSVAYSQLVVELGIQLLIVYGRNIVNKFPSRYLYAKIAS